MITTDLTAVSTFGWWSDVDSDLLCDISIFGWYVDQVVVEPPVCSSWQNSMIKQLRILIDDYDGTLYSDSKLEETLALAAHMVTQEVTIGTDYEITINVPSITPNPYDIGDTGFVKLVVLKAACLLDKSSLRFNSVVGGLRAKIAGTYMRTANSSVNDFLIDNGYCVSYNNAKKNYSVGGRRNKTATLSPFVNENFLNRKR